VGTYHGMTGPSFVGRILTDGKRMGEEEEDLGKQHHRV
jgi:hypothetical protein